VNVKAKQGVAIGFSLLGAVGTISTAVLVREAAKKEEKVYQTLLPFKKGNIKDILLMYKLPIAVGVATVSSIVASSIMSRRAEASLLSMAVMADQGWRRYKNQVKSTLGIGTHNDILKGIGNKVQKNNQSLIPKLSDDDTRELYYDDLVGYFQAKPEDLIYAYATINEMLNTSLGTNKGDVFDGVTIDTFLRLAKATVVGGTGTDDSLDEWGWSMDYLEEGFNECWIHMGFSNEVTDDGIVPYKIISWIEEPILLCDYIDNYDDQYSHEETRKLNMDDYVEKVELSKFNKKNYK